MNDEMSSPIETITAERTRCSSAFISAFDIKEVVMSITKTEKRPSNEGLTIIDRPAIKNSSDGLMVRMLFSSEPNLFMGQIYTYRHLLDHT
jgi:hypothetical protein